MSSFRQHSDPELIALIAKDNEFAFAEIYERYKGVLYLHAYRMLGDEDEAKDILQELFTALWVRRKELNFISALSAYLYQAVRNRVLDVIARKKTEEKYIDSLSQFIASGEYITDHKVRENELRSIIESEVARLPAKMKEIFELSREENLSYKEIADALNISDKTVKKQVSNALKILRQRIEMIAVYFPFV
ncbi:RNA polymerase sigma factor [Larkinella insperata]|uniref:RNA polymerase sigma factor n=1 Tax=Larkinella insperata TaxID=332158 RepID=A0ABW3QNK0_9BACT